MVHQIWRCGICLMFHALSLSGLMTHIYSTHGHSPNFNISCGIDGCARTFRLYHSFYKHVKRHHKEIYENRHVPEHGKVVGIPLSLHDDVDTFDVTNITSSTATGVQETSPTFVNNDQQEEVAHVDNQLSTVGGIASLNAHDCISAEHQLEVSSSEFVLQMKHKHRLNQGAIKSLISGTQTIVQQSVDIVTKRLRLQLQENELGSDEVCKILQNSQVPEGLMENVKNSYQQDKTMRNEFKRVTCREINLGNVIKETRFGRKRKTILASESFYYVPILDSLEQFLQNETVFKLVTEKCKQTEGYLRDLCDGELYRNNPLFQSDNSLAIMLYYDDIEICCPLGSKSRKLSCFYYSLANLPSRYRSKLCNIRLVALAEKYILDKYGIDLILKPLIEDLKMLQNGYNLNIQNEEVTFNGGLYLVLGDTPASHLIGGFKEGVGFAHQKCRACYCTKERMQKCFCENDFQRRTHADYLNQCTKLDNADTNCMKSYLSTYYGITRRSSLVEVPFFDISNCLPQDVMHVIFEGIAQYEVKEILKHYINQGTITLNDLNYQLEHFNYGYQDMTDKPSEVRQSTIKSEDSKLKQNSSQMKLFVKIFPLVLTRLNIDSGDKYMYLLFAASLVEMIRLIMSPVFCLGTLSCLREMIKEHLKCFATCFPGCNIITKQHYLTHIPSCIKSHGPCIHYSCMRNEGKNKIPKGIVKSRNNYKNVAKTAAEELTSIEALDAFGDPFHALYASEFIPGSLTPVLEDVKQHFLQMMQPRYYHDNSTTTRYNNNISCTSHVVYHGIKYICDRAFVAVCSNDGILPEFGKIVRIFVVSCTEIYFELQMYQTTGFHEIFQAYSIVLCEDMAKKLCSINDLLDHHVFSAAQYQEKDFILTDFDMTDLISCQFEQINLS